MKVKKQKINILLTIIFIIIISIIYQFKIINTNFDNYQKVSINKEFNSNELINYSEKENNISKLQSEYQNNDIKGIISIENEKNFTYAVAQSSNNEYYLNHNYKKEFDSLGAIYADYRINLDTSQKVLIFGHSSTKKDTPFNKLEKYYDEEYYNNHKYITLETESNTYKYEIFSVYVETSDFTYMNINFDDKKDWYLHILKLKSKSLYKTDIELTEEDDILILQTCSNNSKYQNYSKKYLLIVSRRVKEWIKK